MEILAWPNIMHLKLAKTNRWHLKALFAIPRRNSEERGVPEVEVEQRLCIAWFLLPLLPLLLFLFGPKTDAKCDLEFTCCCCCCLIVVFAISFSAGTLATGWLRQCSNHHWLLLLLLQLQSSVELGRRQRRMPDEWVMEATLSAPYIVSYSATSTATLSRTQTQTLYCYCICPQADQTRQVKVVNKETFHQRSIKQI